MNLRISNRCSMASHPAQVLGGGVDFFPNERSPCNLHPDSHETAVPHSIVYSFDVVLGPNRNLSAVSVSVEICDKHLP